MPRPYFVGIVVDGAPPRVRDAFVDDAPDEVEIDASWTPGTFVEVRRTSAGTTLVPIAAPDSPRAELLALVREHGLDPAHPPPVLGEVARWLTAPGIDDATLVDTTALPWCTIDGPGTRDLDQALCIEADASGWRVHYAIADAAYYVRPGTALFAEALRRGASYYLPGLSVPMLPRELSEGLVSLNPGVDRRALVMTMHVDASGTCTETMIQRARIHSRAQLEFTQVQRVLDGHDEIDDAAVVASLLRLREVGEARLRAASERDMIGHRHEEIRVELDDGSDLGFVVLAELRNDVERYSEQISLLCNIEGARLLRASARDEALVQPIYRVHDAPEPARLRELAVAIDDAVVRHALDPSWRWDPARESLAAYLARLPTDGPHVRVARAIARQAILVNARSSFTAIAGPHFGIGAEVYARFSAPMREVVGVFVHEQTWDALSGAPARIDGEDELRDRVIEQANRARERQRQLTHGANLLVLDRLFEGDARHAREARPRRRGTVMGVISGKVYVRLDDPPVDVKVYVDDGPEVGLGDAIDVVLVGYDDRRRRWLLDLLPPV